MGLAPAGCPLLFLVALLLSFEAPGGMLFCLPMPGGVLLSLLGMVGGVLLALPALLATPGSEDGRGELFGSCFEIFGLALAAGGIRGDTVRSGPIIGANGATGLLSCLTCLLGL